MHCVNITHPDFKTLKEETKLHPAVLAAKIAIWQEKNNTEDFPSITQINPSNEVSYALKAVNILASPKAEEVFKKGEKNNWSLDKILTELAIPKEQKELIQSLGHTKLNDIITDLLANYSYAIEINIAKENAKTFNKIQGYDAENVDVNSLRIEESDWGGSYIIVDKNGKHLTPLEYTKEEAEEILAGIGNVNTQHYSNLTVNEDYYKNNPDWEYKEQRITTPLIIPSIRGHAEFAESNDIGWFRAWYNKKTGEVHILEVQSDLFQKGRDKKVLSGEEDQIGADIDEAIEAIEERVKERSFTREYADNEIKKLKAEQNSKENQFLQLLNKDNNWVTFFVKSIIQDSAKKGYEKVLFPTGNTASKVEGHTTLEEFKKQKEDRIKELEKERNNYKNEKLDEEELKFINSNYEKYAYFRQNGYEGYYKNGSPIDKEEFEQEYSKIDKNKVERNTPNSNLEKITNEINQLKQELERVEKEGFGALRPIYNFYENTVTNILKKQGYNPVKITDEYGNTWNEVILNQVRDLSNIQFQKLTAEEKAKTIEQVTKEHRSITALKDLAHKLAYRIGGKVEFVNRTDVDWKGYNQGMKSVLNEAYMTPDTPFHEILAHPIIRAINKNANNERYSKLKEIKTLLESKDKNADVWSIGNNWAANEFKLSFGEPVSKALELVNKELNFLESNNILYQSLLKELETGRGKEVFEQVKRDYKYKEAPFSEQEQNIAKSLIETYKKLGKQPSEKELKIAENKRLEYTLEEQQEEAVVTLLGLMAADKLDAKKDATLISKLKELWKQISDFVKSLLRQDGIKIDELPITTTLNDLAEIMGYGNNKIILPGYKVEYSTPLGNKYDTLEEVNNEIRGLADANVEVDLSGVKINLRKPVTTAREIPVNSFTDEFDNTTYNKKDNKWYIEDSNRVMLDDDIVTLWNSNLSENYIGKGGLEGFIEKNKEFEQSKEIIEQWKKENNIQYDPEEVYSRGQGFYSSIGAYSNLELDLLLKNLIQHIEDNKKAGGEFTISAFTKPIDKRLKHIEGTGDRVRFVIYPKSEHIKWAAPTDVYSGSVWDAHEKISKDKKSELLGVSFTKAPTLRNINEVSPNLADIIDNLSHAHNELGIELTTNNFRIEYDDNIDYSTKKLIDNINKILDDKYGKLVKPEIKRGEFKTGFEVLNWASADAFGIEIIKFNTKKEAENYIYKKAIDLNISESDFENILDRLNYEIKEVQIPTGKQPTQTKENTTSIKSVHSNVYLENRTIERKINNINEVPKIFKSTDKSNKEVIIEKQEDGRWVGGILGEYKYYFSEDKVLDAYNKSLGNIKEKEYTQQALTNLKIAALKEVARKYPRSLITSRVVPIDKNLVENDERQYSKKENTSKVNTLTQEEASNLQNKLNKLYPEIKVNFQNLPNESFRGQANLEALSILINKAKENSDTLPHEYAHFYVAWFRDSDKVKQGIRLFGSEEKLVQAIGEQAALRKGKAYTWFQQFWNWIKSLFNKNDVLQDLTQGFLTNKDLGNKNTSIFGKLNQDAVDEKLEKAVNENLNKLFQRIEQLKTRAGGTHHQQIKSNIKALYARAQDLAENRTYEKLAEIALFQLAEAKRIVNSSNPSSFEIDEARRVIEYTKDFDKYLDGIPEFEDKKKSIRAHNVSIGIRVKELIAKDILKAAKRAQVDLTEEDFNKAYKDEAFLASETLAPETSHIPMVALGGNLLNMNKKISSEIFNKKFTVQLNDILKQTGKKKFETSDFAEITEGGMLILPFSSKYFKEQSDMWKEHYDLIKEYKADPASKELKARVANSFDNIFNWYKESSYYYLTPEAEKKYKADLEDVRKANLDSDGNLTSRGKIEVDKWIAENSPYLVGKKDSSGKITIHVNSVPGTRIGDSTIYNQNWHKYLKAEPREKYLNSKWEKASKNPLHQFMLEKYIEALKMLPREVAVDVGNLHKFMDSFSLEMLGKGQLTFKSMQNLAKDAFTVNITQAQLDGGITKQVVNPDGSISQSFTPLLKTTDEKGRPIPQIHAKTIEEVKEAQAFKDPLELLQEFYKLAVNYDQYIHNEPVLNLILSQVEETKGISTNNLGSILRDILGNPQEIEGGLTNATNQLRFAINTAASGVTRQDSNVLPLITEKTKEQLKQETEAWAASGAKGAIPTARVLSAIKTTDALVDFTRMSLIGLKPFTAAANLVMGMSSNYIYAARNKEFNESHLDQATKLLIGNVFSFISGGFLKNKAAFNTAKKNANLAERFGITNTLYESKDPDVAIRSKNKVIKFMYAMQEGGEFLIANQLLIAYMLNTKITSKTGEETNLYEAFDDEGNLKKEFDDTLWKSNEILDSEGNNTSELFKFSNNLDRIRKRTQGDYMSPMRAKKGIFGRIIMMFRTWIPQAVRERFGAENKDFKGRYVSYKDIWVKSPGKTKFKTLGHIGLGAVARMTNILPLGKYRFTRLQDAAQESFEKYLEDLGASQLDMENMRANIKELQFILLTIALTYGLESLGGDDNDYYTKNFLLNLNTRLYQDLSFFGNPQSFLSIVRDPLPITSTIRNSIDVINTSVDFMTKPESRYYQKGYNKGDLKLWKEVKDLLPIFSAIQSTQGTLNQVFNSQSYRFTN